MTKLVGADGLAPMRTVGNFMRRKVDRAELASWRQRKLDAGELIEVRSRAAGAIGRLAADEPLARTSSPAARRPLAAAWADDRGGGNFLAPLDPVSARGRATSLFGFEYIWEIYKPRAPALGRLHHADPVGRPARRALRRPDGSVVGNPRRQRPVAGGRSPRQPTVPSGTHWSRRDSADDLPRSRRDRRERRAARPVRSAIQVGQTSAGCNEGRGAARFKHEPPVEGRLASHPPSGISGG